MASGVSVVMSVYMAKALAHSRLSKARDALDASTALSAAAAVAAINRAMMRSSRRIGYQYLNELPPRNSRRSEVEGSSDESIGLK